MELRVLTRMGFPLRKAPGFTVPSTMASRSWLHIRWRKSRASGPATRITAWGAPVRATGDGPIRRFEISS